LYAVGCDNLPELVWGKSQNKIRLDDGFHSTEERRRAVRTGSCQRLSARQRKETPVEFRDILLGIARSVKNQERVLREERPGVHCGKRENFVQQPYGAIPLDAAEKFIGGTAPY
jgi:hypothetical protein